MQVLTKQELHNLAMNIVGKKLQKMGYEFQAINSQLKRHPQFVLFKKGEPTIFVLVRASNNIQNPNDYDVLWMETFKNHAKKQNAKVWFAGVGIANAESVENPVFKDQPYYVAFDDFTKILE
ncbi:Na(+)-translocating NADH-quinone reductase subunit F [Polaribacter ponticola]|uniref:Na(+)-translocating NADH-quinone reductase subunit F n=1 Tax=Polaribacter ponticola TaxID=2978475 RepID=A0ABT5SF02_9FLAO|nr:Na(+)-translocating NADH-quinone reductase subunit F [Polaribacter sp. MSW5]MDD7915827.1 Na(+)-translocating NADH-quinone reductase subunit F [Polaribacter sp. MSW5]